MEENNSKEVKMQPASDGNKQKKLSYEELQEMAQKLFDENRALRQQFAQLRQALESIDRLDYLLRIINVANNCKDYTFSPDFVQKCIDEIQIGFFISEAEAKENKKNN